MLLAPRPAQGQGRPEVLARAGRAAGSASCSAPTVALVARGRRLRLDRARRSSLEPGERDAAREPALRSGRGGERSRRSRRTSPSSATCTSTTRSAPRTARTRRSSVRRACCRRRRAGCSRARSRCSARLLDAPKQPFVGVLGGVKVSDKLGVIDALLERCDTLLIGGAMAFTFLAAQGGARRRLARRGRPGRALQAAARRPGKILIPTDVVVADEMTADARRRGTCRRESIPDGLEGPRHRARDRGHLRRRRRGRGNRAVERPDGRVRDGAVRGRYANGRGSGRRVPRLHGDRRRRQRGRGARDRASRIASTTCRPVAALRSS